jgi:hypothetical protein
MSGSEAKKSVRSKATRKSVPSPSTSGASLKAIGKDLAALLDAQELEAELVGVRVHAMAM